MLLRRPGAPSVALTTLPSLKVAESAGLGAALGIRHALEPDHLAAVSTLMTGERSSATSIGTGLLPLWRDPLGDHRIYNFIAEQPSLGHNGRSRLTERGPGTALGAE